MQRFELACNSRSWLVGRVQDGGTNFHVPLQFSFIKAVVVGVSLMSSLVRSEAVHVVPYNSTYVKLTCLGRHPLLHYWLWDFAGQHATMPIG